MPMLIVWGVVFLVVFGPSTEACFPMTLPQKFVVSYSVQYQEE